MQQSPLAATQSVSVAHSNDNLVPLELDRASQSHALQGTSAADTVSRSGQCQPSQSTQPAQDPCSAHDSQSSSTSQSCSEEGDMDSSPSTPPGRGITSSHGMPPDAPRKPKQTRPPTQLSPNAPVRKLDFDSDPFRMHLLSDSEQSCGSRHSGPGRG